MNGYGERCGNANLVTIVPALQLKLNADCLPPASLAQPHRDGAHDRRDRQRERPTRTQPYVGKNAFAHKGGMHVAGIRSGRAHVRAHRPGARGQRPRPADQRAVRQGHGAGARGGDAASSSTRRPPRASSSTCKELEHRGYQFEAADGSFDLLIRRATGDWEPLFTLEAWRVLVEKREDGKVQTEATSRSGSRASATCGRPRATARCTRSTWLCAARSASTYPHLRDIELVNFKVRILDEKKGTGAVTRVLLDSSDGVGHVGLDRRVRERDRGELGGARRLARGRHAARPQRALANRGIAPAAHGAP